MRTECQLYTTIKEVGLSHLQNSLLNCRMDGLKTTAFSRKASWIRWCRARYCVREIEEPFTQPWVWALCHLMSAIWVFLARLCKQHWCHERELHLRTLAFCKAPALPSPAFPRTTMFACLPSLPACLPPSFPFSFLQDTVSLCSFGCFGICL